VSLALNVSNRWVDGVMRPNLPNTQEFDLNCTREGLLETIAVLEFNGIIAVHRVCERNLLDLSYQYELRCVQEVYIVRTLSGGRSPTLLSIPAKARAVYAPRENPNKPVERYYRCATIMG
jgi:hypothetical protein